MVRKYNSLFDSAGNLLVEPQDLRSAKLYTPIFLNGEFKSDNKTLAELVRTNWKRNFCL